MFRCFCPVYKVQSCALLHSLVCCNWVSVFSTHTWINRLLYRDYSTRLNSWHLVLTVPSVSLRCEHGQSGDQSACRYWVMWRISTNQLADIWTRDRYQPISLQILGHVTDFNQSACRYWDTWRILTNHPADIGIWDQTQPFVWQSNLSPDSLG